MVPSIEDEVNNKNKGVGSIFFERAQLQGTQSKDSTDQTVKSFNSLNTKNNFFDGFKNFISGGYEVGKNVLSAIPNVVKHPIDSINKLFDIEDLYKPTQETITDEDRKLGERLNNVGGWQMTKDIGGALFTKAQDFVLGTELDKKIKNGVSKKDFYKHINSISEEINKLSSETQSIMLGDEFNELMNFEDNVRKKYLEYTKKNQIDDEKDFLDFVQKELQSLTPMQQRIINEQTDLLNKKTAEKTSIIKQKDEELKKYINENVEGGYDFYNKFQKEQQDKFSKNEYLSLIGEIHQKVSDEVDRDIMQLGINKLSDYAGFNDLRDEIINDTVADRQYELSLLGMKNIQGYEEIYKNIKEANKSVYKLNIDFLKNYIDERNLPENKGLSEVDVKNKALSKARKSLSEEDKEKILQKEGMITSISQYKNLASFLKGIDNFNPMAILNGASFISSTIQRAIDKGFYSGGDDVPHYVKQETRNLIYSAEGNWDKLKSVFSYNADTLLSLAASMKILSLPVKGVEKAAETIAKGIMVIPTKIGYGTGTLRFIGNTAKNLTAAQIYGAGMDPVMDNAMVEAPTDTIESFNRITGLLFDVVPLDKGLSATFKTGGKTMNSLMYHFVNGDRKAATEDIVKALGSKLIKVDKLSIAEVLDNTVDTIYKNAFNPKEFENLTVTKGELYKFVSENIKNMDKDGIDVLLTEKGMSLKRFKANSGIADLDKDLNSIRIINIPDIKLDDKGRIEKQLIIKQLKDKFDIYRSGFTIEGSQGIQLDSNKIKGNKDYIDIKKKAYDIITELEDAVAERRITPEKYREGINSIENYLHNVRSKFAFNYKAREYVDVILPDGVLNDKVIRLYMDDFEEAQWKNLADLSKEGKATLVDKNGKKITVSRMGDVLHDMTLSLRRYLQGNNEITEFVKKVNSELEGVIFTESEVVKNIISMLISGRGITTVGFLKGKDEAIIRKYLGEYSKLINKIIQSFLGETNGVKLVGDNPIFINDVLKLEEPPYKAKAEEIYNMMANSDTYFNMTYGYFEGEGKVLIPNIYLTLGNKILNNVDLSRYIEGKNFGEETGGLQHMLAKVARLRNTIFEYGYLDGVLDIEKGISKAKTIISATSTDGIFKDGKIDLIQLRKFLNAELGVNKNNYLEFQDVINFIEQLFSGLDESYAIVAKPMIYSMLYHYTNNKSLIDAAIKNIGNEKFERIFSDILLAPKVRDDIAKFIGVSSFIDDKYKELAKSFKDKFNNEWGNYKLKLKARSELLSQEIDELKTLIKNNEEKGITNNFEIKNQIEKLEKEIITIGTITKKSKNPNIDKEFIIANKNFILEKSKDFIETRLLISKNQEKILQELTIEKQTLQDEYNLAVESANIISKLNEEKIQRLKDFKNLLDKYKAGDTNVLNEMEEMFKNETDEDVKKVMKIATSIRNLVDKESKFVYKENIVKELDTLTKEKAIYDYDTLMNNLDKENPFTKWLSAFINSNDKNGNITVNKKIINYFLEKDGVVIKDEQKPLIKNLKELKEATSGLELDKEKQLYIDSNTKKEYIRVTDYVSKNTKQDTIVKDSKLLESGRNIGINLDKQIKNFFVNGKIENTFLDNNDDFKSLVDKLENFKKSFTNGEKFFSDIKVYSDKIGVAGEIDLLSIDKDGNIKIYEIYNKRDESLKNGGEIDLEKFFENSKNIEQQKLYADILQEMIGKKVEAYLMPFRTYYEGKVEKAKIIEPTNVYNISKKLDEVKVVKSIKDIENIKNGFDLYKNSNSFRDFIDSLYIEKFENKGDHYISSVYKGGKKYDDYFKEYKEVLNNIFDGININTNKDIDIKDILLNEAYYDTDLLKSFKSIKINSIRDDYELDNNIKLPRVISYDKVKIKKYNDDGESIETEDLFISNDKSLEKVDVLDRMIEFGANFTVLKGFDHKTIKDNSKFGIDLKNYYSFLEINKRDLQKYKYELFIKTKGDPNVFKINKEKKQVNGKYTEIEKLEIDLDNVKLNKETKKLVEKIKEQEQFIQDIQKYKYIDIKDLKSPEEINKYVDIQDELNKENGYIYKKFQDLFNNKNEELITYYIGIGKTGEKEGKIVAYSFNNKESFLKYLGLKELYDNNFSFLGSIGDKNSYFMLYKIPKELEKSFIGKDKDNLIKQANILFFHYHYSYANGFVKNNTNITFEEMIKYLSSKKYKTIEEFKEELDKYKNNIESIGVITKRESALTSIQNTMGNVKDEIDNTYWLLPDYNIEKLKEKFGEENIVYDKKYVIKIDGTKEEQEIFNPKATKEKIFSLLEDKIKKLVLSESKVYKDIDYGQAKEYIQKKYLTELNDGASYITLDLGIKRLIADGHGSGRQVVEGVYIDKDKRDKIKPEKKALIEEELGGYIEKDGKVKIKEAAIKKIRQIKDHFSGMFTENGINRRILGKSLLNISDKISMAGNDNVKNSVFLGYGGLKLKNGFIDYKGTEEDPLKEVIISGKKYIIGGETIEKTDTSFFKNASTDYENIHDESSMSMILNQLHFDSVEDIIKIQEKQIDEAGDKYFANLIDPTYKLNNLTDYDKIIGGFASNHKIGLGTTNIISNKNKLFLDEVNQIIIKPKDKGQSVFMKSSDLRLEENEILLSQDAPIVKQIRDEVSEKKYGKKYKELKEELKKEVDKNLFVVGYRFPISSRYNIGVFKIIIRELDERFGKTEYVDMGGNQIVANPIASYFIFSGDHDGDHVYLLSLVQKDSVGQVIAKDLLRGDMNRDIILKEGENYKDLDKLKLLFPDSQIDLSKYYEMDLLDDFLSKNNFYNNYIIAPEIENINIGTSTKELNILEKRNNSLLAKDMVGVVNGGGRTEKIFDQLFQYIRVNHEKSKDIKEIKVYKLNKKGEYILGNIGDLYERYNNLKTNKDFYHYYNLLQNLTLDFAKSDIEKFPRYWQLEIIGNSLGYKDMDKKVKEFELKNDSEKFDSKILNDNTFIEFSKIFYLVNTYFNLQSMGYSKIKLSPQFVSNAYLKYGKNDYSVLKELGKIMGAKYFLFDYVIKKYGYVINLLNNTDKLSFLKDKIFTGNDFEKVRNILGGKKYVKDNNGNIINIEEGKQKYFLTKKDEDKRDDYGNIIGKYESDITLLKEEFDRLKSKLKLNDFASDYLIKLQNFNSSSIKWSNKTKQLEYELFSPTVLEKVRENDNLYKLVILDALIQGDYKLENKFSARDKLDYVLYADKKFEEKLKNINEEYGKDLKLPLGDTEEIEKYLSSKEELEQYKKELENKIKLSKEYLNELKKEVSQNDTIENIINMEEFNLMENSIKLSEIENKIKELEGNIITDNLDDVKINTIENIPENITYSFPTIKTEFIKIDPKQSEALLNNFGSTISNTFRFVKLRVSELFNKYIPDYMGTYSIVRDFLNSSDNLIANANNERIRHFNNFFILPDKKGAGYILKKNGVDNVEKIINAIDKEIITFNNGFKSVEIDDKFFNKIGLKETGFNFEKIEDLRTALENYRKTVVDPVAFKLNQLESIFGYNIHDKYFGQGNNHQSLIVDVLEGHKSNGQLALKIQGIQTKEEFIKLLNDRGLKNGGWNNGHIRVMVNTLFNKTPDFLDNILSWAKNFHYQMTYGLPSSIMTQNGIISGLTQILPNYEELKAYARANIGDLRKAAELMDELDILNSENVRMFGTGLGKELNDNSLIDHLFTRITQLAGIRNPKTNTWTSMLHMIMTNPLGAGDLPVENLRKLVAINQTLNSFGLTPETLKAKIKLHGPEVLGLFKNRVAINFAESGGGVTSSSSIYRDTLFSHMEDYVNIPGLHFVAKFFSGTVGYLMGWAYHKVATLIEKESTLLEGMKNFIYGNRKYGIKQLEDWFKYNEMLARNVMYTIGLYLKMQKFEKDNNERISLGEFSRVFINNLVSLEILLERRMQNWNTAGQYGGTTLDQIQYTTYGEIKNLFRLFKHLRVIKDLYDHYQMQAIEGNQDIMNSLKFVMDTHYSGYIRSNNLIQINDIYNSLSGRNYSSLLGLGGKTDEEELFNELMKGKVFESYKDKGFISGLLNTVIGTGTGDGSYALIAEMSKQFKDRLLNDSEIRKLVHGGQLGLGEGDYNIEQLIGAKGTPITSQEQVKIIESFYYNILNNTFSNLNIFKNDIKNEKFTKEQNIMLETLREALSKDGIKIQDFARLKDVNPEGLLKVLANLEINHNIPTAVALSLYLLETKNNIGSNKMRELGRKLDDLEWKEIERDVLVDNQDILNLNSDFVFDVITEHAKKNHSDVFEKYSKMFKNAGFSIDDGIDYINKSYLIGKVIKEDTSVAKLHSRYSLAFKGIKDSEIGLQLLNNFLHGLYELPHLNMKEKTANAAAAILSMSKELFNFAKDDATFMKVSESARKQYANWAYKVYSDAVAFDTNRYLNAVNEKLYGSGGYGAIYGKRIYPNYGSKSFEGGRPNFSKQFEPLKKIIPNFIKDIEKDPNEYLRKNNPYQQEKFVNYAKFPIIKHYTKIFIETIYEGFRSKGIIEQRKEVFNKDKFKTKTVKIKSTKKQFKSKK